MRAIVTGASGHIGFHVARELLRESVKTDLLVRSVNQNVRDLAELGAQVRVIDLNDQAALAPLLKGADVLFHLAAENTTDTSRAQSTLASTAGLTRTVLSAAVDAGVKTIVYTSSVVVLGRSRDPNRLLRESDRTAVMESPYVRGKVEAEQFCESLINTRGADIRRVYPSWVIGPNDPRGTPPHRVIGNYLRKGQKFYFSGGISIAAVEEVAKAHVAAWKRGERAGQYVLGGTNLTFKQFFTTLAQHAHRPPPKLFLPRAFMVAAATGLNFALKPVGKRSPVDPAYVKSVVGSYSWYDSARAIRELGYTIPGAGALLGAAVRRERMRMLGTDRLRRTSPAAKQPARSGKPPLLVTGVPGWLGNRMVDVLINGLGPDFPPTDRTVHLLVESRNADLLELPANFKIFAGDLRDTASLRAALAGVGTVFHFAGAIYPPRIKTLYDVNEVGTRALVDACIEAGVRRVLYMGTDSICGHGTREQRIFDEHTPNTPYRHYGRSKWLGERYILEKTKSGQVDGTSLRGFWFFGPFAPQRQQRFLDMMRKPRQIIFGNGKNYRSISHVDNTISAFLRAEDAPATIGKWYWIGDARCDYTVDDIYRIFCEANDNRFRPFYIPGFACAVARGVDTLMAKLGRLHPTIHGIGKFDFDIAGTIDAARRDFGYEPVTSLPEYAKELAATPGPSFNTASSRTPPPAGRRH